MSFPLKPSVCYFKDLYSLRHPFPPSLSFPICFFSLSLHVRHILPFSLSFLAGVVAFTKPLIRVPPKVSHYHILSSSTAPQFAFLTLACSFTRVPFKVLHLLSSPPFPLLPKLVISLETLNAGRFRGLTPAPCVVYRAHNASHEAQYFKAVPPTCRLECCAAGVGDCLP